MINGVPRTGIALIVWRVAGFGWRERAQTERGEQKNFDSIDDATRLFFRQQHEW